MATLTKHEPVLTYERPFEPADEREVQVYIPTTERGAHSRYAKVRPCKGTSCEEILWTINHFKQRTSGTGLNINGTDALRIFLETLGTVPREAYDDMVRGINKDNEVDDEDLEEDPFDKSFSTAMKHFILHIAEDSQAKESVIAAFGDNKTFLKPAEVSDREHQ